MSGFELNRYSALHLLNAYKFSIADRVEWGFFTLPVTDDSRRLDIRRLEEIITSHDFDSCDALFEPTRVEFFSHLDEYCRPTQTMDGVSAVNSLAS